MYYIIIIIESIAYWFIIILTFNISTTIINILVNTLYWYKNNIQFYYNMYNIYNIYRVFQDYIIVWKRIHIYKYIYKCIYIYININIHIHILV